MLIYCKDYEDKDLPAIEALEEKLGLNKLSEKGNEWRLQLATDPQKDGLRQGLAWLSNTIAGRQIVSAFVPTHEQAVAN